DEALYTMQARNSVYTGYLDLQQSDGVIKEPLFAGVSWLVAKAGGDTMPLIRLASLLFVATPLGALACRPGLFAEVIRKVVIPVGYFNYYLFNYSHLAMAEMTCCMLVLAGMAALYIRLKGGGPWTLAAASLSMAICYAYKIQFVYVAFIPPSTFAIAIILVFISHWKSFPGGTI